MSSIPAVEAKYFLLSDINLNVKVRIRQLHGRKAIEEYQQRLADSMPVSPTKDLELYVSCALFSNGSMIGIPVSTRYRCFPSNSASGSIRWDQWLTFSVKYRDLSPTARLVFTVWDVTTAHAQPPPPAPPTNSDGTPAPVAPAPTAAAGKKDGGASNGVNGVNGASNGRSLLGDLLNSVPLMTPPTVAAILANGGAPTSTNPALLDARSDPSIIVLGGSSLPLFNKKGVLKSGRRKLFLHPGIPGDGNATNTSTPYKTAAERAVDRLEKVIRAYSHKPVASVKWLDKLVLRRIEKLSEKEEHDVASGLAINNEHMHLVVEFPPFQHPIVYHQKACNPTLPEIAPVKDRDRIYVLHDPEVLKDNPIESKYHKLSRSSMGLHGRDLKPKIKERKRIQQIVASPNKHLSGDDKELLIRFRYSLMEDKHALVKFLRCVNWNDVSETKQAVDMLDHWALINSADALELLSKFFTNKEVREFAVNQLKRADNEELADYLLQLVQALRYEAGYPSNLSDFLVERCTQSIELANFFNWFLTVEKYDKVRGPMFSQLHDHFMEVLRSTARGKEWEKILTNQHTLVTQLVSLCENAKSIKGKVEKKAERLRSLLHVEKGEYKHMKEFEPTHLPVRPHIIVKGLIGDESNMFKSAMAPLLGCFKLAAPLPPPDEKHPPPSAKMSVIARPSVLPDKAAAQINALNSAHPNATPAPTASATPPSTTGAAVASTGTAPSNVVSTYKTIFKTGDDLRQDQLILQMITLIDNVWRKVQLDLKLTPYRVLATSPTTGFVEFVPKSYSLTYVLQNNGGDIKKFFDAHNPKPSQIGTVLDTFVRSCAGYCVITYVLGIGDRHLENLLLTTDGHLFHIDFGYIFGRDPKPFPPPMKFCKEMVAAMGGPKSPTYMEFRKFTALAFNLLRPHANLLLNLLSLMGDANIPHLSSEVDKNVLKVQEKFRLDLTDEEAETYILSLVDESVDAMFPLAMDIVHNWAMYWK